MDWILDHLQIVIAVAAAIAYWLNKHKQGQSEDGNAADEEAGTRYEARTSGETDDEARARRIREEIRRKISERATRARTPERRPEPAGEPPPLFRRESEAPRPVAFPLPRVEDVPAYMVREEDVRAKAVLERQRKLQEQMHALEQARRTAKRTARTALEQAGRTDSPGSGPTLTAELRHKTSLRRAIVLREVLGPPVGLR